MSHRGDNMGGWGTAEEVYPGSIVLYGSSIGTRAHPGGVGRWTEHMGAPDPHALRPRSSGQMHTVTYIRPPIVCGEHHH